MNYRAILAVILAGITVFASWMAYAENRRATMYHKANQILAQELFYGDARKVEIALDRQSGNVFVRINWHTDSPGHVHTFPKVCRPERKL